MIEDNLNQYPDLDKIKDIITESEFIRRVDVFWAKALWKESDVKDKLAGFVKESAHSAGEEALFEPEYYLSWQIYSQLVMMYEKRYQLDDSGSALPIIVSRDEKDGTAINLVLQLMKRSASASNLISEAVAYTQSRTQKLNNAFSDPNSSLNTNARALMMEEPETDSRNDLISGFDSLRQNLRQKRAVGETPHQSHHILGNFSEPRSLSEIINSSTVEIFMTKIASDNLSGRLSSVLRPTNLIDSSKLGNGNDLDGLRLMLDYGHSLYSLTDDQLVDYMTQDPTNLKSRTCLSIVKTLWEKSFFTDLSAEELSYIARINVAYPAINQFGKDEALDNLKSGMGGVVRVIGELDKAKKQSWNQKSEEEARLMALPDSLSEQLNYTYRNLDISKPSENYGIIAEQIQQNFNNWIGKDPVIKVLTRGLEVSLAFVDGHDITGQAITGFKSNEEHETLRKKAEPLLAEAFEGRDAKKLFDYLIYDDILKAKPKIQIEIGRDLVQSADYESIADYELQVRAHELGHILASRISPVEARKICNLLGFPGENFGDLIELNIGNLLEGEIDQAIVGLNDHLQQKESVEELRRLFHLKLKHSEAAEVVADLFSLIFVHRYYTGDGQTEKASSIKKTLDGLRQQPLLGKLISALEEIIIKTDKWATGYYSTSEKVFGNNRASSYDTRQTIVDLNEELADREKKLSVADVSAWLKEILSHSEEIGIPPEIIDDPQQILEWIKAQIIKQKIL